MSNTKVWTGAERKAQLLELGAKLASKHGTSNVTRRMVAQAAGISEPLVSRYMGDTTTAQRAYGRKAKAMGLPLPDKAKAEAIGIKLRKHKPADKRDTRKRSVREVQAINRNKAAVTREVKPTAPRERKPRPQPAAPIQSPGQAPAPAERKTAARAPKAPPEHAVTPSS